MIRLALDTNVLVSANLNEEGQKALVAALTFARVLLYPRLKFVPKEVARFLTRLRRVGTLLVPTRTISASSDKPDNRFLECAEAAKAGFLVTGNKRHFPEQWKAIRVVNAGELLGHIGASFLTR